MISMRSAFIGSRVVAVVTTYPQIFLHEFITLSSTSQL